MISVPQRLHLDTAGEKARYDSHRNTIDDAGYVATFAPLIALVVEHQPSPATLLDYGCHAEQVLVELFRREGYDAVGYDPHYTRPLEAIAAETPAFDIVVSTETIEHFTRPREDFDRLAALVAARGVLAVMTRFHAGPDSIASWWYARDPTHVAFYSHRTMDWIAREYGLAIVARNDRDLCLFRKPD